MKKFKCSACGSEYDFNYHAVQYQGGVAYIKCTKGDGFAFEVKEEKPKATRKTKAQPKKEEKGDQ